MAIDIFEPQAMEGQVANEAQNFDALRLPFQSSVITSDMARKKTRENLVELGKITGEQFNLR